MVGVLYLDQLQIQTYSTLDMRTEQPRPAHRLLCMDYQMPRLYEGYESVVPHKSDKTTVLYSSRPITILLRPSYVL